MKTITHNGKEYTFGDVEENGVTRVLTDAEAVEFAEEKEANIVLQTAFDAQAYARNRKKEYDQLNQFEMQFDDDRDGTTTWVDTINEIKGRHPK